MTSSEVRSHIVEAIQLDLIGPDNDHECAHELLPESPFRWYLTGYLMSTEAPEKDRFDETSMEDVADSTVVEVSAPGVDDDSGPADSQSSGKSFLPSSMGVSLLLTPDAKSIQVTARWGDYLWEAPEKELEPDEPEGEEEHGYAGRKEGTAKTKGYRREPREEEISIDLTALSEDEVSDFEIPNSLGLILTVTKRGLRDCLSLGLPENSQALSVFLVNYRKTVQQKIYKSCAFQAELDIRTSTPLLNQPDLRGMGNREHQDWDEQLADLQYRDVQDFGVGHGVATHSIVDSAGECHRIKTLWLPRHEVAHVAPKKVPSVEFSMSALANCPSPVELRKQLLPLVTQYREWIAEQEAELTSLSPERKQVAKTALAKAKVAADRIEGGIEAIKDDDAAFTAFQIANRAMARSAQRRLKLDDPQWRPFQLAFILLNVKGIVDPSSTERETVDLLFFPTGGGKTEAYLGLAAMTLVLRRLRNPGISYAGLSVLMRYTLRLLTLDQLGRAAALICALELEREKNEALGAWPFEIGLWVGSAASPNRMGGQGYSGPGAQFTAHRKLVQYLGDSSKPAPIPLESCPWCETQFDRRSFRLTPNQRAPENLEIRCCNRDCEFSRQRALPILTVDETIYRRLPAFLISTVDKFAALPWEGKAGALLGHVNRHDNKGFYGASESGGAAFNGPLPGPDLIIQDELHLISGPLGTIAGIYETAIENLASRKKGEQTIKPKIIASTATVRRAREQIQALFARADSSIFPPQGPDILDTFFSETQSVEKTPGRLYVGVAAQGRSLKVILMRTALAALCAGKKLYDENKGADPNPVDPYMTMMGYFNSLRELGGSRRIVEDEVVSRARKYGSRRRRDPKVAYFADRLIDFDPHELTSRVSTAQVARTKELLGLCFDEDPKQSAIDVALATNMISVGLDITRLGLMVALGQPKSAAEYIQATSRVGRDTSRPGLVLTLLNIHKPRDRSHYEHFELFHKCFYRSVEASSVTPFSPRALDRALAAALVAICRHSHPELTPALGAGAIVAKREELKQASLIFSKRAELHADDVDPELTQKVFNRCQSLLDTWVNIQANRAKVGVNLQYQNEIRGAGHARLLHDFLETVQEPTQELEKFRANRSMRDVEPNVELVLKKLNEPL